MAEQPTIRRIPQWRDQLTEFLHVNTKGVKRLQLREIEPIQSLGNAREPWSFVVEMFSASGEVHAIRCVMLIKAESGQLETDLLPEFHVIRALNRTGVPCPKALWIDPTGNIVGRPFFITEHVAGSADMALLRRDYADPTGRAVANGMVDAAAKLHVLDPTALGLGFLPSVTFDDAAISQVDHWEKLFIHKRMEPLPILVYAFDWLRAHAPRAERISIVHGDFRVGNLIYDDDQIHALLDWEMVHLGDPIEDIAWAYRTLWSPERFMSLGEFVQRYRARTGLTVAPEHLTYYRLFNEIKHCVISLTAARSFNERRTGQLRLADRMAMVNPFLVQFMEWLP